MNEYLLVALGYGAGFCSAGMVGWSVHRRMCRRIVRNHSTEMEAKDVESRRYSTEFVNEDEPRLGAGPEGIEHRLFSERHGTLALVRLAEKNAGKA